MTNRAKSALATAGYSVDEASAITQLVMFAAQNSGIEYWNYYDLHDLQAGRRSEYYQGQRAFNEESRSIGADWRRVKEALIQAGVDGVTDEDVIREAPHAFSGRLEWVSKDYLRQKHGMNTDYTPRWNYCTGQYFPTEYRKAAATLLEYASRAKRASRPPEKRMPSSISELRALNEKNGGCWFEASTMRFFGTKIESGILPGQRFITSEQPPHGARSYSVRSFNDEGDVDTVGEFCGYSTKAEAMKAARLEAKGEAVAA